MEKILLIISYFILVFIFFKLSWWLFFDAVLPEPLITMLLFFISFVSFIILIGYGIGYAAIEVSSIIKNIIQKIWKRK